MFSGSMASLFSGPEIVVTEMCGKEAKQVRLPRSKRRRIQKKWRADRRNWSTPSWKPFCAQVGGRIICDPATYAKIAEQIP
jgi:hypothetical protein